LNFALPPTGGYARRAVAGRYRMTSQNAKRIGSNEQNIGADSQVQSCDRND